MSRATVRQAFVTWLGPPNVRYLANVYPYAARNRPAAAYNLPAGGGSGAWAQIHIGDEWEARRATGGPTSGEKQLVYRVDIALRFRSVKDRAEDAQADYDTLIESLKQRIRADRTFGGALFQAGEGMATGSGGAPDLHLRSDLPRQDKGQGLLIWAAMTVTAVEFIAS